MYRRYFPSLEPTHNKEKVKREKPQNRYEMLVTRVIQCRMKDEVKMKQQKRVKEVKCFRYWGVGHCK